MNVVSVDVGTKFVAYAVWDGTALMEYGKAHAHGSGDAGIGSLAEAIVDIFYHKYHVYRLVYESAFLGTNVNVTKQLSKAIGSTIAAFYIEGVREFASVPPITWQTGIGVGKSTYKEKERLRLKYPDKSVSWLRNKDRENRKQKVIDLVNAKYGLQLVMDDNDVADAIAIGWYFLEIK